MHFWLEKSGLFLDLVEGTLLATVVAEVHDLIRPIFEDLLHLLKNFILKFIYLIDILSQLNQLRSE